MSEHKTGSPALYFLGAETIRVEDPPFSGKFIEEVVRHHRPGVIVEDGIYLFPTAHEPGAIVRNARFDGHTGDYSGGTVSVVGAPVTSEIVSMGEAFMALAERVRKLENPPATSEIVNLGEAMLDLAARVRKLENPPA